MTSDTDNSAKSTRLGSEPVGKLLLSFSIPCIAGMFLNALYNVVDRIFVGRGVDEIALGGISLVMPLMILAMAFAMLFGIGAANMISMRMGQGKKAEAESALNHCFLLLFFAGIMITVLGTIFLEPVLSTLGARSDSKALDYARRYFRIIVLGQVFFQISFGLSHTSRAQGFPGISLIGMIIGAGLNTMLDPIFIFGLHMGVEGAAYATIISQAASAIFMIYFSTSRKAIIRLHITKFFKRMPDGSESKFKLSPALIMMIMTFGCSNALLQFAMSTVQLLLNKSIGWYGASGLGVPNGDEIALSAVNIMGSVVMLILMPVFGINQGSQPILGFNYGAKKFSRVRSAFVKAASGATCICIVGFLLAQIFPHTIVRFFVPNGSPELLNFTPWVMRVSFAIIPLVGFQIVAANMFVVTGRPKISIFLAMLRQVIILIPCMLIFGKLWGLHGIIFAQPVSDLVSVFVTLGFVIKELKILNVQS
ncbi:MAG: MATE family efflux transporter [Termitinemataceae bacterium]|nr:MAG: MATE family efflux transporter [Termitinemataceae bacterium]